jgi:uncharacterized membrane protein YoaK (UPF0700 family)
MTMTRDIGRTTLLCLIGGSADAIAYLRYGTFVGAMTGNTVLLGIDLAERHLDSGVFHLCVIAAFLLAVTLTHGAGLAKIPASVPLVVTAVLLGGSEFIANQWSAVIAAAALGMQNAAVRKIGGVSVNSVFVTGDLLSLGEALSAMRQPAQRNVAALLAAAWTSYAAGAALGAIALHALAYPMLVPAVLALLAAVERHYRSKRDDE